MVYVPDAPVTALILREHLADLLAGEMTLGAFDEWFTEATWDDANVSPDALRLARNVELLLAEYSSGVWSWPDLRAQLAALASAPYVAWGGAEVPHVNTGTTASTQRAGLVPQFA